MHRVWFVQQKHFDHMPLKAGLGMITEDELKDYNGYWNKFPLATRPVLCPKKFTTRTRRMSGEYYVVQGSRFKAIPLDTPIQFRVTESIPYNLRDDTIIVNGEVVPSTLLDGGDYTFPEMDLGIKGTNYFNLRDELLKLNKKTTVDTKFFINRLEPL